ncbi:hypothetical protein SCHPADRAFT_926830 [Schizopora paradoxa]|uniref:F-box domain-containing protein n=1 Tax=Schizopora paradoxa TaxID=27342 RepID=A0A0H2RWT6_9AGAM|nr:hypothetical protein SCHPADRAFT_926830 [Schizopora paradoxa]
MKTDTANTNVAANVPPELLDRIFKHCERHFSSRFVDRSGPTLLPKSRLQPPLLVCRNWHTVAERRLYSSVSLGTNRIVKDRNGQKMEIYGRSVCRKFLETAENNPRIASLVRELHMGGTSENREESENHVRLIGICKNVEKIELYGCHTELLDDLAEALAKADLTSLELYGNRLGGYDGERGTMLSLSTIIELLQNLPRLQQVYGNLSDEEGMGHDASLTETPLFQGSCASLRVIHVYGAVFNEMQLAPLTYMSPNVIELSITVGWDCCAILQFCMSMWSSSLKRLTAFTPIFRKPIVDDACTIIRSPMTELRELCISSPLVTPSAMVFLPKLEKLNYRGEYSHGTELVQILKKGAMPNLRQINAAFSPPKSDDVSNRLERDAIWSW